MWQHSSNTQGVTGVGAATPSPTILMDQPIVSAVASLPKEMQAALTQGWPIQTRTKTQLFYQMI